MPRGRFISLDGIDGSGKSTQCRLLADWLRGRGREVTLCADPGSTPVGDRIRELLLDRRHAMSASCEALLFMASRAQLTAEVIRPALEQGHVVVTDRYLLSTVVYQGHASDLDPERLWQIGLLATDGLEPDLTVLLDMPANQATARTPRTDRFEGRDLPYHERVREGFLAEARRRPDRVRVVDAAQPVEVVHTHVCQEVAPVL